MKMGRNENKIPIWDLVTFTLVSGINVAPWIKVAPGKFGKKISVAPSQYGVSHHWVTVT